MSDSNYISIAPYLDIIHRHRISSLCIFGVGLVLTLVLVVFYPNRYRSTAVLIVRSPEVSRDYVTNNLSARLQARLHALSELVLSQDQLSNVIQQYNLYPKSRARHEAMADIVEMMRRRIEIGIDNSSGPQLNKAGQSFSISFSYTDPSVAQQVTAKLADTFINDDLQSRVRDATATTQFVADQLAQIGAKLAAKGQELKDLQSKFRGSLPGDMQVNLQAVADVESQLRRDTDLIAQLEQKRMEIESEKVQAGQQDVTINGPSGQETSGSPEALLSDLQTRLTRMRAQYSDSYPDIIALKEEVAALKKEVKDREQHPQKYESPVERQFARESASMAVSISNLQHEIAILKSQLKALNASIAETPAHAQMLASVQRDYQVLSSTYHDLLSKKISAQMAESLEQRQEGERLDVLDPASLPTRAERPDRLTAGIGGLLLSVFLALAVPFMLFFTDTSFKDPDEIRSEHGLPVAATIPLVEMIEAKESSRTLRLRALAISSVCTLAGMGVIWFAALKGIL